MSAEQSTFLVTRVFSREDGGSDFEDIYIPLTEPLSIGILSKREPVKDIIFRETPGSYDLDWHPAPQRQYIMMLQGGVDITTRHGGTRRFDAGTVILVEDTHGEGHKSKAVEHKMRKSIFVTLE